MVYGDQVQLKDFTPLEKGNYMTPVILENIPHNSPAFNGNYKIIYIYIYRRNIWPCILYVQSKR